MIPAIATVGLELRRSDARRYLKENRPLRRAGWKPLGKLVIVPDPPAPDEDDDDNKTDLGRYRVGPRALEVLDLAAVDPRPIAIAAAMRISRRAVLFHVRSLRLAGLWAHDPPTIGRPAGGGR